MPVTVNFTTLYIYIVKMKELSDELQIAKLFSPGTLLHCVV